MSYNLPSPDSIPSGSQLLKTVVLTLINYTTQDRILITLEGAAKIGYYAGSDRNENTITGGFRSCLVESGNCFDEDNPRPFYINKNGVKINVDGYFVVYGQGGIMFKDKNIIILADLPNPEEKTCIIMTKIKFEKLFSFDP